ncbi:MAG TPA: respiratory nitrate reductase subunit gamma, partial [Hanamia sp.]|nr:respiratory nitrate reductase subunit gamma [Hanamia sp.]
MDLLNNFLLIALPYLALAIFLIGTIYRYKFRKFQVSSLSSQFLESKQLFWGSVPFHWGILFIFCGHLIAFSIPNAVLAWNSQPV